MWCCSLVQTECEITKDVASEGGGARSEGACHEESK